MRRKIIKTIRFLVIDRILTENIWFLRKTKLITVFIKFWINKSEFSILLFLNFTQFN